MISPHVSPRLIRTTAAFAVACALLTGCKSKQDAAIEQASKQANATGQPQQVVSADKNGNTITTTIQPLQQGQTTQAVTTTVTPATAPNPQPAPAPSNAANQAPYPPSNASPATNSSAPASGGPAPAPVPGGPAPAPNQPIIQPANVSIAAGTPLTIRINQHISVKHSHAGDRFTGEIEEPVVDANNAVLIPRGTPVEGVVDASHRRGHFKGRSILELRLTTLTLSGTGYPLDTRDLTRTKKGKGRRTAAFMGGGAGAGMLIGGIATGGVGLVVGGLAGGGAGAVVGGLTGNRDIEIPAESIVRFKLADDLVVQAP